MEHGSRSVHDDHQAKSSSDSNPLQAENRSTNNVGADDAPRNVAVQEDDRSMPIPNLLKIMRKVLPPQAKVAEEAKQTMQVCVSEFISFVTSEANERCHKEHRRIVTAEDILCAMDTLGFDDYVGPLAAFLKRYRRSEVEKLGHLGGLGHVPMRQVVAGYRVPSPLPPLPPQRPVARYGPNFPAGPSCYQGMFESSAMCGSYDDGSGGSGNVVFNFDPLNIHKRT
ncbi:Nuclear transcription factor Y subunit B-9 [Spatholobus suberectus]|nr:Nuclear transcription factor Y subunit B-9 [Spatholobus suberectus]